MDSDSSGQEKKQRLEYILPLSKLSERYMTILLMNNTNTCTMFCYNEEQESLLSITKHSFRSYLLPKDKI